MQTLLNPEQRLAVEQESPLLVIAGAGSGKTNTLAHRVALLLEKGAEPDRIMLLTFSRRAAEEMKRRVERIHPSRLSWAGTFHGVAARLLREYAGRIGLDPSFTIHDREDSGDLMNMMRHELGFSEKKKRFPLRQTCLSIYSSAVNTIAPLEEVLQKRFPWCAEWHEDLKALFLAYVEEKQKQNVLDYDDLLLYWSGMLKAPILAREMGERFTHVLVDEYQDTNLLQAAILLGMKPEGRGLTVVGDDAQSIYSFRGAEIRNILGFPEHFDPPAKIVKLERNYRSTGPILDAANGVIGLSRERYAKTLTSERHSDEKPFIVSVKDETEQASYVVEDILGKCESGMKLKSQAVLFRAAHHSAVLELELMRRNIPYVKFGGLKFLESAHVKDLLSILRWMENPRDRIAGFRVLQLNQGIGPKTASHILDNLDHVQDFMMGLSESKIPGQAEAGWKAFLALFDEAQWPAGFEKICSWYEDHLFRLFDDAKARSMDIEQLQKIASTYPSRQRFLTELTLDPPGATSDEAGSPHLEEDYLILSTIHSAKGQEWRSVHLLNAVDGCLPSDLATGSAQEIEEERRLLYVAMTRAKDHLAIIVPQRFHVSGQHRLGDRHVYAGRTRFIPSSLLTLFERQSWPPAEKEYSETPKGEALDLLSKMKSMWR